MATVMSEFDYTIIHVNDDRVDRRNLIHDRMWNMNAQHKVFDFCYGKHDDLDEWYSRTGIFPASNTWSLNPGEIGIWQSLGSIWSSMEDNLLVFEDDVFLHDHFDNRFIESVGDLPPDADFLSLFVPEEQRQDYKYVVRYDELGNWHPANDENKYIFDIGSEWIARTYHGWGGQALYFTMQGAEKLLRIARARGMYTTSDCFLYLEAHAGNINGYSVLPEYYDTVYIDKSTKSIIQER